MPDLLDQIQREQLRGQEEFVAQRQRDIKWDSTFGNIPPSDVLRQTRDMTSLISSAVEKRMELAAQTDAEAQKIYINNERFKRWQGTQDIQDDLLRERIKNEGSLIRARAAAEKLTLARETALATKAEHTALAQWEMDEVERAKLPPERKREWLKSFGRYSEMDDDARKRHEVLLGQVTPLEESLTPAQRVINDRQKARDEAIAKRMEGTQAAIAARDSSRDASAGRRATEANLNRLVALRAAPKLADKDVVDYLDGEITRLRGELGLDKGQVEPVAASTEGAPDERRVRQKSTGKTGVIRNGEFIPDAD